MKIFSPLGLVGLFLVSLVFTLLTHPGLWSAFARGYAGDHLFNLSTIEIVGLAAITSVLVLVLFLACTGLSCLLSRKLRANLPRWAVISGCGVLALVLCAMGLAVVPQIHYQYFRLIISGLPAQWVPMGDLSAARLSNYFFLPASGHTTDHAKGITVWICVCASLIVGFRESKQRTSTFEADTKPETTR